MLNEHTIQSMLVAYIRNKYPNLIFFAVPNGGFRNPATGRKLRQEGVLSGIPDLFLALAGGNGKHGLFVEMKSLKGKLTVAQRQIAAQLESFNYQVSACYGYEEAKETIEKYIRLAGVRGVEVKGEQIANMASLITRRLKKVERPERRLEVIEMLVNNRANKGKANDIF